MKPRRMSRQRWVRARAHALQQLRLELIASGKAQPLCNREEFYLRTLREDGHANPADFIIPYPMLLIEELMEIAPPGDESNGGDPEWSPGLAPLAGG